MSLISLQVVSPKVDFLVDTEKHLRAEGSSDQIESFNAFKQKITEAVKKRKVDRKTRQNSLSRRDSTGSNGGLKRTLSQQEGKDPSRAKFEN